MGSKIRIFFENAYKRSKIGHAFLIGNTTYDDIKADIENVIKKFINQYNTKIIPYIVETDNMTISKEQILNMQSYLFTTSQFDGVKVFVIDECEKMNPYGANSLLKLLEDPPANVYGFLITKNIDSVIETIKSRCQIVFVSSGIKSKETVIEEEDYKLLKSFIKEIKSSGLDTMAHKSEIYKQINDREQFSIFLNDLLLFYKDMLNYLSDLPFECYNIYEKDVISLSKEETAEELTRKMLVVYNIINKIGSNVNINLLIDKLIIELGR